jgi:hypothetical protein
LGSINSYALMWSGTAASVVELHPPGFDSSTAIGVSGGAQVGYGRGPATVDVDHALLWNGTAASMVDLHPFLTGLGPNFTTSRAIGIADNGAIVGEATAGNTTYAVLWEPIPEPTSAALGLMALACLAAISSRRSR